MAALSFGVASCASTRHISDWREQSFPMQEIYASAAVGGAMRKAAFTILSALLFAGSAAQMAAASEHHMRTAHGNRFQNQHDVGFAGAGRGLHQSGRANNATPPALDAYGKPPPNVTQTCDIKWCYAD
jgi:hypothetical protein